ncbi:MAG: D-2-hydroxyacid dehydrogenase family protein [Alphaproteobacteria bacterium]|jgi:phosphoglycerate dehydrogenase-like enzyme|nr:D-2-hydroxyacid dehydrogenase family protein [Alphaproteobacteria bacterium]MBT4019347.1 D-2-hydroxyacid dehydrogenase family protein [Alphaproteobacteria bacterium]MBT4966686.1 D-2-hydroxyacid dehydrogenase family protein [Alphaproteobacteria bacterium]MBT5161949.1 D-2-hydroxyacid dehydrogenase family protein [Alphaproteobacteria bacterium]MBT5919573.1 D-2-hydroxyacid dehydrogenase family protein [Alphaproteobacteria bacterium]
MLKVAILDDYQNAAMDAADWGQLSDVDLMVFDKHLGHDEPAIVAALQPFDIIVAMRERTRFPRSVFEALPNLKMLVSVGMRNLAVDAQAARDCGIDVCGTDMLAYPAFEHAWALILSLTKQITVEDQVMKNGGWQHGFGVGLNGKTLGILGLGRLGKKVATVAKAFDMNVIAWSENLTSERAAEAGVGYVDKETLFREADILSVHLLMSPRSKDMVGAAELALMKPSAYLVNSARGPIVNEAALLDALENKLIAGAALDVYDVEPLPVDHKLRKLDNVILTGHTGFVIREFHQLVYQQSVEDIQAWQTGNPLRLLNPTA